MYTHYLKALALLAVAALSSGALAETPGRAGRISLVQGQVNIGGEVGSVAEGALLNWPVTSNNQISTARDARAEFRVGSTAVRLDGDSALDIEVLDDDTLRLRLHYGSISVRVRNADNVRGFELSTPQGQIRLKDVSTFRVDVDRKPDTTLVNVFHGAVQLDGSGASLVVRAGRRAELQNDELHTGLAVRDGFDDWAALRDQRDDRVNSTRYVSQETTGYEDLDQHGSWTSNNDYGAIWIPRSVPVNWVPYRDGRWAWIAPWGWTWVDNAPWGYAPFHYGRWVVVGRRWCWAPGRHTARPVWAPALVGWVGGGNWQLSFNIGGSHRRGPAMGWYPLSPRDHFVPGYKARTDHVRQINAHTQSDHDHRRGRDDRRGRHRDGITVVPHGHFDTRHTVVVPTAPRALTAPSQLRDAPSATPPMVHGAPLPPPMLRPPGVRTDLRPESRHDNRHDGRHDNRADNRHDNRTDSRSDNRNDGRNDNRRDRDDGPAATPRAGVRSHGDQSAPNRYSVPGQPVAPAQHVAPVQPAGPAQQAEPTAQQPPATLRPPREHRPDYRQQTQQPAQAASPSQQTVAPISMPPPMLRREPERERPPAQPRAVAPAPEAPRVEAPRAVPPRPEQQRPAPDRQERSNNDKQEKREKSEAQQERSERSSGRPDR